MNLYAHVAEAVAAPAGLILVGFVTRRLGWFRAEADASLATLSIRLLYPCFILRHLTDHEALSNLAGLWVAPAFGFLAILAGFLISGAMARFIGLKNEEFRTFTFSAGIFNYGFFAFPVGESLFGEEFLGKLILFNLGVEVAIWTVGIVLLLGKKPGLGRLLNPPTVAIAGAWALTSWGGWEAAPCFAFSVVDALAACAIPVGLLLIGGSVSELLKERNHGGNLKVELAGICSRLVLVPAVLVGAAAWVPFAPEVEWLRHTLVVQAAMPAGVFALVVVKSYGGDALVALRVILATMAGCILTLPFWLALGLKLTGSE